MVIRKMVLRSRGTSPSDVQKASLWSFPRERFLQEYWRVAGAMNALWIDPTLCGLRHGGASRDVLMQLREMSAILRVGRWAHLDSVRHY